MQQDRKCVVSDREYPLWVYCVNVRVNANHLFTARALRGLCTPNTAKELRIFVKLSGDESILLDCSMTKSLWLCCQIQSLCLWALKVRSSSRLGWWWSPPVILGFLHSSHSHTKGWVGKRKGVCGWIHRGSESCIRQLGYHGAFRAMTVTTTCEDGLKTLC